MIEHKEKRADMTNCARNASIAITVALVLSMAPVSGFSTSTIVVNTNCACGSAKVLLILAEFPEYPHLSSRSEISRLFFGQVARYFSDVSYGRLSVEGNATDWITLPKLYEQYHLASQQPDKISIARDSVLAASQSFNLTQFDVIFLVLSFYPSLTADYIPLANSIITKTGSVNAFVAVEEDRDWSAYARAFALAIGLWNYRVKLSGLGQLDIVSGGLGDMSSWSKLTLGWINNSQIESYAAPPVRRIAVVSPIESPTNGTLALVIRLSPGEGEYLIDARQSLGYDRNNLQEYGVMVTFVPPGNGSLDFRTVLQPDNVGRSIFLDLSADLSIVVLNQTSSGFRLLVGSVQDGRDAQKTLYAISQGNDAIQMAIVQNRIDGLDLAQRLAANAHDLFTLGRFAEAQALAVSAETTANSANIPSAYNDSVQLITNAEDLKSQTQTLFSDQSRSLVSKGNAELELAKQAFIGKNFTTAAQNAQAAIDSFNRAKQIDFTERIFGLLSNLALIIPVAVLIYVLRYQLKSR
jgi:hypothetical protein